MVPLGKVQHSVRRSLSYPVKKLPPQSDFIREVEAFAAAFHEAAERVYVENIPVKDNGVGLHILDKLERLPAYSLVLEWDVRIIDYHSQLTQ